MTGSSARVAALLILSLVVLMVPPVLGFEATIEPATIQDRNPISINLSGVTDGVSLNVTLTATFTPPPGVAWLNLTNWNYPFALQGGRMIAGGRNVNEMTFLVREGNTFMTQRGSGAGTITVEIPLDVQPMATTDFSIAYKLHDNTEPVTLTLVQQGSKKGLEQDAVLTPSILGIVEGNLSVQVRFNGTLVGARDIQVLEEAPLPPTPEVNVTATPMSTPVSTATSTPTPSHVPTTPATTQTTSPPVATKPVTTPPATEVPVPDTPSAGPSPFILAYGAVIVIIALLADYYLLKD
ncbi:MAG TPA: hypothetical protein VKO45_04625 [Methanomicrobiales archaeon]|nr:hypothetical protein [Methanomicrobiales archaeon]